MVKAVSFFKRRSGMSVEAFQAYWLTRHPDVVVRLPGIRRYVQSHTLPGGYRKGEPAYDGIAEIWFDDTGAMRALAGTPAYAPAGGVKNVEFVTHRPGMAIDAFQRYWREVHGPLASRIPVVRRYVQSHTRRSAYASGRAPVYDGVALTWFDDTEAMRASARCPEYARVRADEPNFITAGPPFIITREHVIVG